MSKSKKKETVPSYDSLARLQQMLALRSLAPRSREAYLTYVQKFALPAKCDPASVDEASARAYLVYLRADPRGQSASC